jgi:hypothetical protein
MLRDVQEEEFCPSWWEENGEDTRVEVCVERCKIPLGLMVTSSALRLQFPYHPRGVARFNFGETLLVGFRTATSSSFDNQKENQIERVFLVFFRVFSSWIFLAR